MGSVGVDLGLERPPHPTIMSESRVSARVLLIEGDFTIKITFILLVLSLGLACDVSWCGSLVLGDDLQ